VTAWPEVTAWSAVTGSNEGDEAPNVVNLGERHVA
jgi:hypothetical protein